MKTNRNLWSIILMTALLFVFSAKLNAHSTDETYIWLNPVEDHYSGEVQIRLPDLREYLKLEIAEDLDLSLIHI